MSKKLIGVFAGDIIGSIYEWHNIKTKDFPLFGKNAKGRDCHFTDDTVMTCAVAEHYLNPNITLCECMTKHGKNHLHAGYGSHFKAWLMSPASDQLPYNSWGNGAAMRCAPSGWLFNTLEETLEAAKATAEVTHNHPEGIKGAQATAACIFLLRNGKTKEEVKEYITEKFGYDLNRTCDEIRPTYTFDVSCQGTVPEAIIAFLESTSFEDAMRNAISLGGDSDTLAAICGGIAEAYYEIPDEIVENVMKRIPNDFKEIVEEFNTKITA